MTNTQFDALVKLLQIRTGPSQAAARLVLIDGMSQTQAAKATELSLAGVGNVLRRFKNGLALAKQAALTNHAF